MLTSSEPLEQVITPRGPFMASRKVAMKSEPNIELRCSKTLVSSIKMRGPIQRNTVSLDRIAYSSAVLFSETVFLWIEPLFRRIGPRVSLIRTFSKTNAPIPKKHPVFQLAAGSGMTFLSVRSSKDTLWNPASRKWS